MAPSPRSTRWRRVLAGGAATLLGLYALVLAYFRFNEDAFVFFPTPGTLAPPPAALGLDSRDVSFAAADGVRLWARVIQPPPGITAAAWILYFHGNSGNIADLGYNEAWARFRALGLGVLAVDYRGYGASQGVPSEAGFYRDADAAYAHLTGALRVPPSRVLIYGYSLGAAVAIDLASRAPAAGLLVEGPFLSVPTLGSELYPFLPTDLIARNRFDSASKVARISTPKLILHARADEVIPFSHGERLFARAAPPKHFVPVEGGHISAHKVDPRFFQAVADFVAGLGLPVLSARAAAHPAP